MQAVHSPVPAACAGLLALGDFHGVSTQRDITGAAAEHAAAAAGPGASPQAAPEHAQQPSAGAQQARAQQEEAGALQAEQLAAMRRQEGGGGGEEEDDDDDTAEDDAAAAAAAARDATLAAGQAMPDLQLAAELALTCYELYRRTPAGLAPEIVHFANNTGGERRRLSCCLGGWLRGEAEEALPAAERTGRRAACRPHLLPLDVPVRSTPIAAEPGFPNKHLHDVGAGDFSIKPKVGRC